MKVTDIEDIMDGCAFLEYCGNLYEYAGHDKENRLLFQNVNDDSHIAVSYGSLVSNKWNEYSIAY